RPPKSWACPNGRLIISGPMPALGCGRNYGKPESGKAWLAPEKRLFCSIEIRCSESFGVRRFIAALSERRLGKSGDKSPHSKARFSRFLHFLQTSRTDFAL